MLPNELIYEFSTFFTLHQCPKLALSTSKLLLFLQKKLWLRKYLQTADSILIIPPINRRDAAHRFLFDYLNLPNPDPLKLYVEKELMLTGLHIIEENVSGGSPNSFENWIRHVDEVWKEDNENNSISSNGFTIFNEELKVEIRLVCGGAEQRERSLNLFMMFLSKFRELRELARQGIGCVYFTREVQRILGLDHNYRTFRQDNSAGSPTNTSATSGNHV